MHAVLLTGPDPQGLRIGPFDSLAAAAGYADRARIAGLRADVVAWDPDLDHVPLLDPDPHTIADRLEQDESQLYDDDGEPLEDPYGMELVAQLHWQFGIDEANRLLQQARRVIADEDEYRDYVPPDLAEQLRARPPIPAGLFPSSRAVVIPTGPDEQARPTPG